MANSLAFISTSSFTPIVSTSLRQASLRLPHSLSRPHFSVRTPSRTTHPRRIQTSSTAAPHVTPTESSPAPSATPVPSPGHVLSFQEAIQRLSAYWAAKGCIVWQPYNVEVGAGTMNPATFLRVVGPEPWNVAYDEPSIRPDDSRFGENPNRLQRHTQFQVILKPAPRSPQELVLGSYQALGIDTNANDIRFVEDNWESPALGAWGLGWEIWLNGMEITQFTYFQQAGGITLDSVAVEVTYGLERIIMGLQNKTHFKDIVFTPSGITYGEIFMQNEIEMSKYNMNDADIERNKQLFAIYEGEALDLLSKALPIPAYNYVLKASHTFNILDARGAIGVTERARYFQRMRALSREVAKLWLTRREELDFPLLASSASIDDLAVSGVASQLDQQTSESSTVPPSSETSDFVLEIGVEELPADEVTSAIQQVETQFKSILHESRLSYANVQVDGTPRRISVQIKDLQTRQTDQTKLVRGPPISKALKDGELTKAALGFMRSQKVERDSVKMDENEGYMYATVNEIGQSTADVLSKMIPEEVLGKLNFSKSMRWNASNITFSRPLRWLLCLLGDHVIPFEYADVKSSNFTRSLRLSDGFSQNVVIKDASGYDTELKALHIMKTRSERKEEIVSKSKQLADGVNGVIPEEYLYGGLMEEIIDLVENPIPIIGSYDEIFLNLPKEVLQSVMVKHQRYLPVMNKNEPSNLINKFITVVNGDETKIDKDLICQGNEAVLRARYSDASFFYENDTNDKQLKDFIPSLDGIIFQEKLGSILDKQNRLVSSVDSLRPLFSLSDGEAESCKTVANLYKADLATSMVIEMTSLAGIIGKQYTLKSKEVPSEVSEAIFEANLPRFSGDQIATTKQGAVVAIADRMDSLVGLFCVGLIPKSTADPFALRRAALGVVQTLIINRFNVNINDLIKVSVEALQRQLGEGIIKDGAELQSSVSEFVAKRLEGYLLDNMSILDDVVKCTLAVNNNRNNPLSAIAICNSLQSMIQSDKSFVSTAQEAHSRAARLLSSLKDVSTKELMGTEIKPELFEGEEEQALWNALSAAEAEVKDDHKLAIEDQIRRRLECLAKMKGEIDAYFDGVFVNAEDANVRKNRLAVCAKIISITHNLADLSYLVLV